MKRPREVLPGTRKSARISERAAAATKDFGQSQRVLRSPQLVEGLCVDDIDDLREALAKYKRLLPFANGALLSPHTLVSASLVESAALEAQKALLSIAEQSSILCCNVDSFEDRLSRCPDEHWYAAGNMFDLEKEELAMFFETPIADTDHFASCFSKQALAALKVEAHSSSELGEAYVDKVFYLMDVLLEAPGGLVPALHTYVFLWTEIFRVANVYRLHYRLGTLQAYICEGVHNLPLDAWGEPPPPQMIKRPVYWDYARARRTLWQAMNHVGSCQHNRDRDTDVKCFYERHSKLCFRRQTLPFLAQMQASAWHEVKSAVVLAVGRKLPAELVKAIFEHTLESEGVSLEPSIFKPEPIGNDGIGDHYLREEYACGVVRGDGKWYDARRPAEPSEPTS